MPGASHKVEAIIRRKRAQHQSRRSRIQTPIPCRQQDREEYGGKRKRVAQPRVEGQSGRNRDPDAKNRATITERALPTANGDSYILP